MDEMESEIQEIVAVVEDLQYELDHARQINDALQEAVEAAGLREKGLKANLDERVDDVERQSKQLDEKEQEIQTLLASLTASDEERNEAAKEIRQLTVELDIRDKEMQKKGAEITVLEEQIGKVREEAAQREHSLKAELRLLEEKQVDLREKLERRDRDYYDMKAQADELQSHNHQLQMEIKGLERSRAALENLRNKMKGFRERVLAPAEGSRTSVLSQVPESKQEDNSC
jgi:chromosome segregation ATPase